MGEGEGVYGVRIILVARRNEARRMDYRVNGKTAHKWCALPRITVGLEAGTVFVAVTSCSAAIPSCSASISSSIITFTSGTAHSCTSTRPVHPVCCRTHP